MMNDGAIARPRLPHLLSALIAGAIPLAILCGGRVAAIRLEKRTIRETAPKDFFLKNQGLAYQRAAARASDILLLYGSSELTDQIPNRAPDYFSTAPTGFVVCPVGKPGATSLIILQKLGALGSSLRNRKVAISISPSFFFRPAGNPGAYAGNFSLPAASGLIFGNALDLKLKSDIAIQMLQFPDTLSKSELLRAGIDCLASGHPRDRVFFLVISMLGKLQNVVLDLQDHFGALIYNLSGGKAIPHSEWRRLNPRKLGKDEGEVNAKGKSVGSIGSQGEDGFLARIATTTEWVDLELLYRTLNQIGAEPLVLSMPLDGGFYDSEGVSRSARQVYYDRMQKLADRYHISIVQFEDHDGDPSFQVPHREHPTPTGWMFYNHALDQFFHTDQPREPKIFP